MRLKPKNKLRRPTRDTNKIGIANTAVELTDGKKETRNQLIVRNVSKRMRLLPICS